MFYISWHPLQTWIEMHPCKTRWGGSHSHNTMREYNCQKHEHWKLQSHVFAQKHRSWEVPPFVEVIVYRCSTWTRQLSNHFLQHVLLFSFSCWWHAPFFILDGIWGGPLSSWLLWRIGFSLHDLLLDLLTLILISCSVVGISVVPLCTCWDRSSVDGGLLHHGGMVVVL